MTTANPPPGALAVGPPNDSDPFAAGSHDPHRQRFAAFDDSQFSLYLNASPAQAKRALEAHLAETTRRLQETSHIGNALVQQRQELEEKIRQVEQQQQASEIGPELRQRLAELEKEFNEVGRETARAFFPKSRVPSGEADSALGQSVYSSEAQHSPTKVSVPSRRQRNQQPSRINDIALATEISTSLLSQLKELQAVLLQRDEDLKAADLDRSQLEIEVEGLSQRLRVLDESESRLKDVNWSLETQVREFEVLSKAAADKEQRLNHALSLLKTEKSTLEREFEDLKQQFTKLSDDYINKTKQNETELASLRRNVTMTEIEKNALQRKVEDLSNQNQELARAVAYRIKVDEHHVLDETSPDDNAEERDSQTPEHSPPPSPNKATPRHGMLESETLKHSLQHAHRMIQQLKNNIHREKTEKIELKRMLQDARDELETNRPLTAPGSAGKRKKNDKDMFKKPARPDRLGALRSGTHEILEEDEDWEEQEEIQATPSRHPRPEHVRGALASGFSSAAETSANEGFETANEMSDAAFETANERDGTTTETDAFLTGAETIDGGSSDELTETEAGPSTMTARASRSPLVSRPRNDSYESTASTSGDEFDNSEFRTPIRKQNSRFRLRHKASGSRGATPRGGLDFFSSPLVGRDSPASFASNSLENTPAQGKSLFAELNDLSGDEDDASTGEGTPSRSSVVFSPQSSPENLKRSVFGKFSPKEELLKALMVDSGMMTEPEPLQPIHLSKVQSQGTEPQLPRPATLQMSGLSAKDTSPQTLPQQTLVVSSVSAKETLPHVVIAPALTVSGISGHGTDPEAVPVAALAFSTLSSHESVPKAAPVPALVVSSVSAQHTSPQTVPMVPMNMSSISMHHTEPKHVAMPSLAMSSLSMHHTEPQHLPTPSMGLSSLVSHETQPLSPATVTPSASSMGVSNSVHQSSVPVEGAYSAALAPASLLVSGIHSQSTEPREAVSSHDAQHGLPDVSREIETPNEREIKVQEQPKQIALQMSNVSAHATEPATPRSQPSAFSAMSTQATEPFSAKRAVSQYSQLSSHMTEPVAPRQQPLYLSELSAWSYEPSVPPPLTLQKSGLSAQSTEPVAVKQAVPQLSSILSLSSVPVEPRLPALSMSFAMSTQASEPIEPLKPAQLKLSMLSALTTEPIAPRQQVLQHAEISAQHTEPKEPLVVVLSHHGVSGVTTLHKAQPESPTLPSFLPTPSGSSSRPATAHRIQAPLLSLSSMSQQDTEPREASRPVTAHRSIAPTLSTSVQSTSSTEPGFFDSVFSSIKDAQAQGGTDSSSTREMRAPLAPISSNTVVKSTRPAMSDGGTQTMVSADQIDKLLLARSQRNSTTLAAIAIEKAVSPPPSPSRRYSNELRATRRPGSSSSVRSRAASPPPLPADHKEVIAAAAKSLPPPSPTPGAMGPPMIPASAYKKRPTTPSIKMGTVGMTPKTSGTTPRARRQSHARSGASSPISRRSSFSSFTSEVDQRFNIQGGPSFAAAGLPPGATDPRMIQAITQTMIGEYLWKYTRKTGREGLSENRHRRFFWIHPYTRTLYWSDRDPQSAGKTELKGKSVAIESVQEVEDNNPLPPGLHQKSLIISTPGRSIKFTAPTGQRHETWYNALRYLCQRVDEDAEAESAEKPAASDEIQDEFNAGYRSSSRATGRSKASMNSYMTTRRTLSPHHTEVPTLRPSQSRVASTEPVQGSTSGRFSILRPTSAMRGSFSSRRSRSIVQEDTTYEGPSSADMDLGRDIHEHMERDVDNMVNVRACCDGKHDVGHLHSHTVQGRHNSQHAKPARPSFMGSLSSRSTSRNESRAETRNESRNASRSESRNERARHESEMEAGNNYGAGH
ncbi:hypothetical protein ACEQ8H_007543 [Pleosporales sp. CAS-2024a]